MFRHCLKDARLNQLLATYQQRYTARSPQYADCVAWCAYVCEEFGDNKQASRLLKQSAQAFKNYGKGPFAGRDTVSEIFRLDVKSKLEYGLGRDYAAVRLSKRSCELKRRYFGEQSEPYLNALLDLSKLYAERLKYGKSNRYHNQGYTSYVELIKREFCSRSESERTVYWNSAVKYINKTIDLANQSAGRMMAASGSIASAAYNATLLSKGLLLNTSIGFENYVNESGNAEAMRNLTLKKNLLARGADQAKLDSLDYVILRALRAKGQEYNIPQLSVTWRDVAAALAPNDLAIEFYRTTAGSYGAILVKRDWKAPRVVRLPDFVAEGASYESLPAALSKNRLETCSLDEAAGLWALGRAVWTDDIVKHFPQRGDGKVFFSADGELLVNGIEYLPFVKPRQRAGGGVELHTVSDLFALYRLSSTRELAAAAGGADGLGRDAVVYGGLRYDMSAADLAADMEQYPEVRSCDVVVPTSPDSARWATRGARVRIQYLKGTKEEADSIVMTINDRRADGLSAQAYTDRRGTEASFKALSGKRKRVIHVATHGFYNAPDSAQTAAADNPLARSGLLFAGADGALGFRARVPEGVEDGVLTSLEIAALDLRGLDLVALSACRTAQGDVEGDGVFGLQRGFKMASAKSILMSLWRVDDDATRVLMTEFYRQWTAGSSKREALERAKARVRANPKWQDPRFWAAFVLLDGLD